jgi:hypothetical protein
MSSVPMALLRASVTGDDAGLQRALEQLTGPGERDGLAALTQTAFVIAARRKFAPAWSRADVIRYVAMIRVILSDQPDLVSPLAAENELRIALGESLPAWPDDTARATAQMILLTALVQGLNLDPAGIDQFLGQARELSQSAR